MKSYFTHFVFFCCFILLICINSAKGQTIYGENCYVNFKMIGYKNISKFRINSEFTLKNKECLSRTEEKVYYVSFDYDFSKFNDVYIDQVGYIENSGSLSFFTTTKLLRFINSNYGSTRILLSIDIDSFNLQSTEKLGRPIPFKLLKDTSSLNSKETKYCKYKDETNDLQRVSLNSIYRTLTSKGFLIYFLNPYELTTDFKKVDDFIIALGFLMNRKDAWNPFFFTFIDEDSRLKLFSDNDVYEWCSLEFLKKNFTLKENLVISITPNLTDTQGSFLCKVKFQVMPPKLQPKDENLNQIQNISKLMMEETVDSYFKLKEEKIPNIEDRVCNFNEIKSSYESLKNLYIKNLSKYPDLSPLRFYIDKRFPELLVKEIKSGNVSYGKKGEVKALYEDIRVFCRKISLLDKSEVIIDFVSMPDNAIVELRFGEKSTPPIFITTSTKRKLVRGLYTVIIKKDGYKPIEFNGYLDLVRNNYRLIECHLYKINEKDGPYPCKEILENSD